MKVTTILKGALIVFIAMTAASANAANFVRLYNFDNVNGGATANSALGADAAFMNFKNLEKEFDDPNGVDGDPFHWVDATATYGDVLAKSDTNSITNPNVLWNDKQPFALIFTSGSENVTSFSLQLAGVNTNAFLGGSVVSFLDATYHVIAGSELLADSNGFVSFNSPQNNVAGIFIAGGGHYDNLGITISSVAAVPEAETSAMLMLGLGLLGLVSRRRNKMN